jgi:hypothetical protein
MQRQTDLEIAEPYEAVSLVDVYATIAYYLRYRPEVDSYLRQQEHRADQMRREIDARSDRAEFRERLLARAKAKHVGV